MSQGLLAEELLARVGLTPEDLDWFHLHFQEQMRLLTSKGFDGRTRYARETVLLLSSLSAMRAQGATPDQIKGWFGMAASRQCE